MTLPPVDPMVRGAATLEEYGWDRMMELLLEAGSVEMPGPYPWA